MFPANNTMPFLPCRYVHPGRTKSLLYPFPIPGRAICIGLAKPMAVLSRPAGPNGRFSKPAKPNGRFIKAGQGKAAIPLPKSGRFSRLKLPPETVKMLRRHPNREEKGGNNSFAFFWCEQATGYSYLTRPRAGSRRERGCQRESQGPIPHRSERLGSERWTFFCFHLLEPSGK